MAAPRILFYDWPHSPFCMKVRAILDYKGLAYRAVNPLGSALLDLRRRGKTGKVPAIEIDGELIVDSTDIAYALDQRFPDPPLLPEDPRQRALCHALEDWADESLYFIGLYYRWYDREGRRPVAGVFGKTLVGWLAYPLYLRRILGQVRGQGTLRKTPEHVRRDLERHLDAIDALLTPGHSGAQPVWGRGEHRYLLGDQPYLCDFALWGQLEYLRRTPAGNEAMKERAAIGAFLETIKALKPA